MRVAIIDIGSNSTKLVIGENSDGDIKVIESLKNVIGIGKNTFYNGRISQEILNELIVVLNKYQEICQAYEVDETRVIATTAVREAENKGIFLDTIFRKTGFQVEVLNVGDVVYYIDAFLSFKLKKDYPIHEKNLLIAELGAGSLDISILEKGYTLMNLGVPIGTLRLKQFKSRIDASQKETYEAVEEYVENEILSSKKVFPDIRIDDVILIDESYSAHLHNILASKKRDSIFYKFKHRESKQFLAKITNQNLDALAHKFDVPDDIAESIDTYAIILNKLFKYIKHRYIYMLETSLSQALLANIIFNVELSKKYNKSNQLVSVAKFLCRKYDSDIRHVKQVASLAETLYKQLKDNLGLKSSNLLYLSLAAHLYNIGLYISNRDHHKHTEYIINSLSLFRLTELEINVIACIARYHRQEIPQESHFLYSTLGPEQQLLIQKLSSLLKMAHALDCSHKLKVKKMRVVDNGDQSLSIVVDTQESFALEKVSFCDVKSLFEEVSGNKINLIIKRQS